MNTKCTIIGKTYLPTGSHVIFNATIECRNGEGLQGITFYANNEYNVGDTAYVRPYLRKKDNKWIYLLTKNNPIERSNKE